MDRARATRLSLKCMSFIEENAWAHRALPDKGKRVKRSTAAVITITGSSINFTPVTELEKHADMENRRGKNVWWADYKHLTEIMGSKDYFAGKLE